MLCFTLNKTQVAARSYDVKAKKIDRGSAMQWYSGSTCSLKEEACLSHSKMVITLDRGVGISATYSVQEFIRKFVGLYAQKIEPMDLTQHLMKCLS